MKQHVPTRGRFAGFTLIELLVVIAIIALLAAILFPVFSSAREKARQISCASNLKNLGLCVLMYSSDYDENFPPSQYAPDSTPPGGWWGSGTGYWPQLVYPYHGSLSMFFCPSHRRLNNPVQNARNWNYGANYYIISQSLPSVRVPRVQSPSKNYMLFDSGFTFLKPSQSFTPSGDNYLPGTGDYVSTVPAGNEQDIQEGRHNGGVNVCYVDGHVKWTKPSDMVTEAKKLAPTLEGAWNFNNP